MYVRTYVCMYVCMYACMYVRTYVCTYVCARTSVYIHTYMDDIPATVDHCRRLVDHNLARQRLLLPHFQRLNNPILDRALTEIGGIDRHAVLTGVRYL